MELPPLGLYIHLPWCERKCPYCDFNSHEATQIPEERYVDALLKDLQCDLPLVQACGMIFCTTYVALILVADVVSILTNPRLRHPK